MLVTAVDQGIPQKTAEVGVMVTVHRNSYKPEFAQSEYVVTVNETLGYGAVVVTVTADDGDATLQPDVSFWVWNSSTGDECGPWKSVFQMRV